MSSKRAFTLLLLILTLVSCQEQGIRAFWKTHSIDYSDIDAAEDQFADFAEQAVAAPEKDALAALDDLFDKLKRDTVAYYIYSDWMSAAFYNLLSPCRNAGLFSRAVERMVADGIVSPGTVEPFLRQRDWIQYNQQGELATVPGITSFDERTLVLVLDVGCTSCRQALETVGGDPRWTNVRRVAVCCGYGPRPDVPAWEYLFPDEKAATVFDPRLTPIYFVVAPGGNVELPYTLAL